MNSLQLIEIYAKAWQQRDVTILAPYLADNFSYTSVWVFESLNRNRYLEYLKGKFDAIKMSGSKVDVTVGTNTIGDNAVILRQDSAPQVYITIVDREGMIAEACMSPF